MAQGYNKRSSHIAWQARFLMFDFLKKKKKKRSINKIKTSEEKQEIKKKKKTCKIL